MKITLTDSKEIRLAVQPFDGATFVRVEGDCRACRAPLDVRCARSAHESRDVIIGEAACVACNAPAGTLRVEIQTLFGPEEDECVLRGPWKVY